MILTIGDLLVSWLLIVIWCQWFRKKRDQKDLERYSISAEARRQTNVRLEVLHAYLE
jgi:hypothetical protein